MTFSRNIGTKHFIVVQCRYWVGKIGLFQWNFHGNISVLTDTISLKMCTGTGYTKFHRLFTPCLIFCHTRFLFNFHIRIKSNEIKRDEENLCVCDSFSSSTFFCCCSFIHFSISARIFFLPMHTCVFVLLLWDACCDTNNDEGMR